MPFAVQKHKMLIPATNNYGPGGVFFQTCHPPNFAAFAGFKCPPMADLKL